LWRFVAFGRGATGLGATLAQEEEMTKLWGGRFHQETDSLAQRFNASLPFDVRMYDEDIDGSIAWAEALVGAGVLTASEATTLRSGLEQVRREFAEDSVTFVATDEDIHSVVERRLIELVGDVGRKLHTGRSRNDQVATDFRLWLRRAAAALLGDLNALQEALVESAAENLHTPMPGYTHLQHAQPSTWGHWILSHFWALTRDRARIRRARAAANVLPLGSGALAGTAYDVDREALARALGFVDASGAARLSENSLDAVADRDFAADFLYAAAMLGVHLSRLSEQLILFSSAEFGFVVLSDAYSTGSSLMPQKKNPDMLELVRGKSGRLIGYLTGLLVTLKGLPSAYDKDLQEDKEPVFAAYDTLALALPVMAGLVSTLELRPERLRAQVEPALMATDLADYLVRRGVPFRTAHEVVGKVVRRAEVSGVALDDLSLADLQAFSDQFEADVRDVFSIERALATRAARGGTAPDSLAHQLQAARAALSS
jgi:argininosuccinate lyase